MPRSDTRLHFLEVIETHLHRSVGIAGLYESVTECTPREKLAQLVRLFLQLSGHVVRSCVSRMHYTAPLTPRALTSKEDAGGSECDMADPSLATTPETGRAEAMPV